ncbi:DUF952 domain-containing protein [Actinosynnema pretiosum subsp. pretiosum]|uniref:Glutathione S-transferase domain protein n=5 Tax=Actinosynnema TaxID=40566 RepID=C6WDQ9_ACTMD|nr:MULTISPECIES: DUF952 domain-containing protein [Actinosynnema]ACU34054.1 protein of unknown function DUF952 [Actinosynnema mirum DSM 43827]ATE51937.1 DUF952 domain-containing protein [Actinosynnema pretiosum]AXX27446.1 Glutathione S-transferase domain protein [Actinosynnema pretiosum subsp. pretiosum]QUF01835.1 DUF952 domain-containing protein [Actinosynnema pretiosum subsp. pretiosum]
MLLRISTRADWAEARESGAIPLDLEGFVHCADPGTVHLPANSLYRNRSGLVLLVVDPEGLPVLYEPGDGDESGPWFPHVYGPIPADSVVAVLDFEPDPDGVFRPPPVL